jgi:hypothetical protein
MKINGADMGKYNAGDETYPELDADFLKRLAHAVKKTQFGSIEIVIHDGRIVQIETREKYRFEKKNKF